MEINYRFEDGDVVIHILTDPETGGVWVQFTDKKAELKAKYTRFFYAKGDFKQNKKTFVVKGMTLDLTVFTELPPGGEDQEFLDKISSESKKKSKQ